MAWKADRLLAGFEALELGFPDDYDGRVVATLVRLPVAEAPRGAVLYVHGFIDYFFQRHMAERFAAEGFAFYALDLRKHGRSLLPHQHPCFCKDINEYFADIDRALAEIDGQRDEHVRQHRHAHPERVAAVDHRPAPVAGPLPGEGVAEGLDGRLAAAPLAETATASLPEPRVSSVTPAQIAPLASGDTSLSLAISGFGFVPGSTVFADEVALEPGDREEEREDEGAGAQRE